MSNIFRKAGSKRYCEPRPLGEILREMAERNNELGRALRSALQCVTTNDRKEAKDGE